MNQNLSNFPYSLYQILDVELYVVIGFLSFLCFVFYRFFLKNVSQERHQNINNHLKKIHRQFFALSFFFVLYMILQEYMNESLILKKMTPYIASIAYLIGVMVFVRACRLLVLMYLFLGSMTAGVPMLIVNIFSLLLFVVIGFWSISNFFSVQLTPLIATSAAFSVILGLALQDTLGNLFAGISMQIDKTFEIGDWIEIQNGTNKITGQVKELSWRSTLVIGLSDEMITVPNKVMALSQISNFSPQGSPIIRSQFFRIPYHQDRERAKEIIENSVAQISDVRGIPAPFAFISEVTEHWVTIKIIYFIDNYGRQFSIGDKVLSRCLTHLMAAGFTPAHQTLLIEKQDKST